MKKEFKTHFRRNLPHIRQVGAMYFITASLYGSLPKSKLLQLKEEHRQIVDHLKATQPKNYKIKILIAEWEHFKKYDEALEKTSTGSHFLKQQEVIEIVKDRLHEFDKKHYHLIAYTIMSNHFHLLIDTSFQLDNWDPEMDEIPKDYVDLSKIMQLIKGGSGRYANLALERKGQFWMHESYDRIVRNDREEGRIINYILNNPVKAGLVQSWEGYPHTYLKP